MYKEILHMGDQSTCQSVLIIATILYFCMVVFVMIVFVMFVFVEFVFVVVVFNSCCCQHNYHHHYKKKSRIRETTNLSTDANRSIDTERNIQGFFSSLGNLLNRGWAAVHSTAEH